MGREPDLFFDGDEDDFQLPASHPSKMTPQALAARSAWEKLSQGKTIGKYTNVRFNTGAVLVNAPVDILSVQAPDDSAMALTLMLATPMVSKDPGIVIAPTADAVVGPWQDNIEALGSSSMYTSGNSPLLGDAQALIEWGAGGVQHRAIVDMANGMGVHLNASFVRVRGQLGDSRSGAESIIYRLGAQIAPGNPKPLAAQLTHAIGNIDAAAESATKAIPRFARRVSLLGSNVSATPGPVFVGSIRFWRNPTGATLATQHVGEYLFSGNAAGAIPLPIPNGAYYYSIVSQLATPNKLFAIFDLAI